jgi:hypothetical protein
MSNYQKFVNGVWVDDVDAKVTALKSSLSMGGHFEAVLKRANGDTVDEFEFDNVCTQQGLISLLNNQFTGATQITNWYLGLFQNNYTPVGGDTASSFPTSAGEFTGYAGGARPAFQPTAATASPTINNSSAVATFTFTGAATIYGAFLTSVATLGSGSGILFSAAQFGASKNVSSGDQLLLTYALTAATA